MRTLPKFLARRIWTACGAFALLAACTKVGGTTQELAGRHPWTQPGVLRIGVQSPPNTLNAILPANTTESMIDRLMFDPLVSTDATGKHDVPILAAEVPTLANGGVSGDGLTITYHLRKNVKWHDGVPFTSADVKFTFDAIMNNNNNVISRTGYQVVRSVDTPDKYTVVFHMKQRFAPAVDTLFAESDEPYGILPAHLLSTLPNVNTIPFNSSPVGTGPFKFKEWARGDHITLVPNDDYFLGKPKLSSIVIKFIPDENTEINQLRSHELDWQFEASPDEYRVLQTVPDIKLILQERNDIERLEVETQHPPLDDVRVRQAIMYTLDRNKLVHDLTAGSAALADEDLPPFMWAHTDNVPQYSLDLAKARALMTAAGWNLGSDGYLHKNGGPRLSLTIVTNSTNVTRRSGVVQVQAMLRRLGIDLQVKTYIPALLFAQMQVGGILQSGKFDLAWTGWIAGVDPDQSSIFLSTAQPPNGNNESHYVNPQTDALEEQALQNFDMATRKAAYARLEAILVRDLPQIPIWWPRQIQPINPDFKGFTPNPVTESWNAYEWSI